MPVQLGSKLGNVDPGCAVSGLIVMVIAEAEWGARVAAAIATAHFHWQRRWEFRIFKARKIQAVMSHFSVAMSVSMERSVLALPSILYEGPALRYESRDSLRAARDLRAIPFN
jgi:hypothetical protein